jgi:Tfp pilus assembly protein PilV
MHPDMHLGVRLRSESGISLVEVMVTIMLLTISLLGLAVAFPVGRAAVMQGRVSTREVALAEQRIETARNTPYATLPTLAGTDTTTYAPYTVVTAVAADAPAANLTTVTVTITAPSTPNAFVGDAGPQNVVVESFFSKPN